MDPLTIGSGFMSGLKSLQGGAGGAAGPSGASGTTKNGFDNSGWNINFGSGEITSSATKLPEYLPYVLAAAAVLIVWRMTRKR